MVGSRTLTALAGLALSIAVSLAAYVYFDTLLLFLFVPFVPILLRGGLERESAPPLQRCPRCDFTTRDPGFDYCPRDGSRLRETD